jgi:GntR family transcriptional repressor for pyruvate dehydrogenase complex
MSSMSLSRKLSQAKSIERQRLVQAEHLAVLEAIRRHDARGAERAMREHLANAMERMVGA